MIADLECADGCAISKSYGTYRSCHITHQECPHNRRLTGKLERKMEINCEEAREGGGSWVVEIIYLPGEGDCTRILFSGRDAEKFAKSFTEKFGEELLYEPEEPRSW
jgi:hypothetical protein